MPLVRLIEGGGASVSGAYGSRGRSGYDLTAPPPMNLLAMEALATVPVACAALGPCAGFPAGRLVASHFSMMTRDTALVLTGGPALVERATRREAHEGGARRRGRAHARAASSTTSREDEADACARSAASSPSCRRTFGSRRRARRATTRASAARRSCSASCRASGARPTRCAAWSSSSSIAARSSRSRRATGAVRSRASRASRASPSA